jgi:tetratricopeptide (TPR) repeat protein
MRTFLIAITFLFSASVISAQSPLARRAFDEATRLANAGDFHKAVKGYRTASAASSDSANEFVVKVHYNLGVCYYRTGQLEAAVKELSSAVRLSDGSHQRAYYALGMTRSALEDWRAARDAFANALELNPRDGEAWFDLAFVYLALRDYDQAAAAFRKSIENKSVDSALGHNNLGVIMAMRHDYAAAETAFGAALRLTDGRLIEARANLEFCRTLRNVPRDLVADVGFKIILRGLTPGTQEPSPA